MPWVQEPAKKLSISHRCQAGRGRLAKSAIRRPGPWWTKAPSASRRARPGRSVRSRFPKCRHSELEERELAFADDHVVDLAAVAQHVLGDRRGMLATEDDDELGIRPLDLPDHLPILRPALREEERDSEHARLGADAPDDLLRRQPLVLEATVLGGAHLADAFARPHRRPRPDSRRPRACRRDRRGPGEPRAACCRRGRRRWPAGAGSSRSAHPAQRSAAAPRRPSARSTAGRHSACAARRAHREAWRRATHPSPSHGRSLRRARLRR